MTSWPNNLYVYTVTQAGQDRFYISPLPTEFAFEHGLPSQAVIGQSLDDGDYLNADRFVRNDAFMGFLHQVVETYGPRCQELIAQAAHVGTGKVFIVDQRIADSHERIEAADIVGLFVVEDGVLGDYLACPSYQLLNELGIMQLPKWLHEVLVKELKQLADEGK